MTFLVCDVRWGRSQVWHGQILPALHPFFLISPFQPVLRRRRANLRCVHCEPDRY